MIFLRYLLLLGFHANLNIADQQSDKAGASTESTRRLPDVIIIGVKKGGTRALLEYLRINPLVRAPGPEVHFFDRYLDRGLDWYRRQMPLVTAEQTTIEKTPSYWVTRNAPERIHQMNPNVKLLVVVRNPITRALSDYTQTASKRAGIASFERMAFVQQGNGNSAVNTSWAAIKLGLYERYARRWLHFFPRHQIHFVYGERLVSDPAREMAGVEKFLQLPHTIRRKNFVFDYEKGFPCILKRNLVSDDGTNNRTTVRCLGKTKGRSHPIVADWAIERLTEFFRPHSQQFFKLIGRTFPWHPRNRPMTTWTGFCERAVFGADQLPDHCLTPYDWDKAHLAA